MQALSVAKHVVTVRTDDADRARRARNARPRRARYTSRPCVRVTDYALARRAVLRDFQQGALTRLDVCDAHPELLRAATYLGTELDDDCPVCGNEPDAGRHLRLRRQAQAGERPLHRQPARSWPGSARPATSSPVTTSRSASTAAGTTCAGSRCTAACTPADARRRRRPRRRSSSALSSSATASCGYCEQHETHHSSGSSTTVCRAGRVPRLGHHVDPPHEHQLVVRRTRSSRTRDRSSCSQPAHGVIARPIAPVVCDGVRLGTLPVLPGAERALDGGGAEMATQTSARVTAPDVARPQGWRRAPRHGHRVRRAVGADGRRRRAPT